MRFTWLLLLCGVAHADVALPVEKPPVGWAQVCVARFKKARAVSAKIRAVLASGKIEVSVDEEVWPLVEHVQFSGQGVLVNVDPNRRRKPVVEWMKLGPGRRLRAVNGRVAELRITTDEEFVEARLLSVWQEAADDCLAAREVDVMGMQPGAE
jgi:hypothetical protein